MRLCIYAIVAAGHRTPEVAGVRLRAVRCGTVSALGSPVRRVPAPAPAQVRRYHRVVAGIAEQVSSILPARFGTVMDDAELDAILSMRGRTLTTALRHVRGRVQMTIRVPAGTGARQAMTSNVPRPSGDGQVRRRGTAYLQTRAAETAAERQIPGFEPVRAAVRRWVRDERIELTDGIASVYHLVPRTSVNAYARAVHLALDRAGMRAVLSGPFPPYAFTSW